MIDMGCVEDKFVTPYVIIKHVPTGIFYVDFPLATDSALPYQNCRFYSDEVLMPLEKFREMCKGHITEEGKWVR